VNQPREPPLDVNVIPIAAGHDLADLRPRAVNSKSTVMPISQRLMNQAEEQ